MIRATFVLLAAHLVIARLRRSSAAQRHLLWAASLGGAALLPLLGVVLPAWQPEWVGRLADALPGTLATFRPWSDGEGAEIVVRAVALEPATGTLGHLFALIWPVGTAVALLLLAPEIVKLARIVSSAEPVPYRWVQIADEIALSLGTRRHPTRLWRSSRAVVPITWGIWRPQIVLPTCAAEWSEERLRAVLAHELAHVCRGDWLVHIHAELVCAVYWFHPLFWTARNRMCRESEQAADDMVLGLGADGEDYAAHLLAIVRAARPPARLSAATMTMARSSHLEARIASLVSTRTNRRAVTAHVVVAAGMLTIAMSLPLAAMSAIDVGMDIRVRTANLPRIVGTAVSTAPVDVAPMRGIRVSGDTAGATLIAPEVAEYTTPPLYSEEARRRRIEGTGHRGRAHRRRRQRQRRPDRQGTRRRTRSECARGAAAMAIPSRHAGRRSHRPGCRDRCRVQPAARSAERADRQRHGHERGAGCHAAARDTRVQAFSSLRGHARNGRPRRGAR